MSAAQTTPSAPQCPTGRTAIVTGDSRGIGVTVAHRPVTNGVQATMIYRSNIAEADAMASRIRSIGTQTITVQAGVGDAVSADTVVNTVREASGVIDTLVNNTSTLENQSVGSIGLMSLDA